MIRRIGALVLVIVVVGAWQARVTNASDPTATPTPGPTSTPSPPPSGPEAAVEAMTSALPPGRTMVLDYGDSGYRYKVVAHAGFTRLTGVAV